MRTCLVIIVVLIVTTLAPVYAEKVVGTPGTFTAFNWMGDSGDKVHLPNNILSCWVLSLSDLGLPNYKGEDPIPAAAVRAKTALDKFPVGRRRIFLNQDVYKWIGQNISISLWEDKVIVQQMRDALDEFWYYFVKAGGKVDYVDMDNEGTVVGVNWFNVAEDPASYKNTWVQIENDPRFATDIKPRLAFYGWVSKPEQPYLYYLYGTDPDIAIQEKDMYIMAQVSMEISTESMNRAYYEPTKKYLPNVKFHNYWNWRANADYDAPVISGYYTSGVGEGPIVGNVSAPEIYGFIWGLADARPPKGLTAFERTPFHGLLEDNNLVRQASLSSPEIPVTPYIGWPGWVTASWEKGTFGDTDYYSENLFHAALCNPDTFMAFIMTPMAWNKYDETLCTQERMDKIGNLLHELDEVAGFADRVSLIDNVTSYNKDYLLTGLYAGGRNRWRITPDLDVAGITRQNFLVTANPPTFQIGQDVIVFPKGSAIYTPAKEYANIGYWVTSPKGTAPTENGITVKLPKNPFFALKGNTADKKADGVSMHGEAATGIDHNKYIAFQNVDFGVGAARITFELSSSAAGGTLEVWLDHISKDFFGNDYGKRVGVLTIPATGSKYKAVTAKLAAGAVNKHHVYLVYKNAAGGSVNIKSMKFVAGKVPDAPSPAPVFAEREPRPTR